jgi:hypothetical protein
MKALEEMLMSTKIVQRKQAGAGDEASAGQSEEVGYYQFLDPMASC